LLIVLLPGFGVVSVWLVVAVAWWCPGAHRLRPRRDWFGEQGVALSGLGGGVAQAAPQTSMETPLTGREQCSNPAE
jgi:hypothetical protein